MCCGTYYVDVVALDSYKNHGFLGNTVMNPYHSRKFLVCYNSLVQIISLRTSFCMKNFSL
jgi:hypothetical protein